jgi:hypothetical protein
MSTALALAFELGKRRIPNGAFPVEASAGPTVSTNYALQHPWTLGITSGCRNVHRGALFARRYIGQCMIRLAGK